MKEKVPGVFMKIVCLGDSITYGYGLANISDRWTDLVAARTGHELINCGVTGDTTAGMLLRCQVDVLPLKPDAVILLGGTNDINITGEYRTACVNTVAILKQLAIHDIQPIMGLPLPMAAEDITARSWDWERDNIHNAAVCAQYVRWLTCYSAEKSMPVADFHGAFLREDKVVRRELLQDGIHPTAEGHRLMADILCALLQKMTT